MTQPVQEVQTQSTTNDKEINFQRTKAMYERQLEEERAARQKSEEELARLRQSALSKDGDDDNYSEPYIDEKKFKKKLNRFGEQSRKETQSEIQRAVQMALENERKQNWMKQNPDFYEVMQHAEKFASKDPELAETILRMPEGFERQKLVYRNIKAM